MPKTTNLRRLDDMAALSLMIRNYTVKRSSKNDTGTNAPDAAAHHVPLLPDLIRAIPTDSKSQGNRREHGQRTQRSLGKLICVLNVTVNSCLRIYARACYARLVTATRPPQYTVSYHLSWKLSQPIKRSGGPKEYGLGYVGGNINLSFWTNLALLESTPGCDLVLCTISQV